MGFTNIRCIGGKLSGAGLFDKADPYVYFYIDTPGIGAVKGKTTTKENTNNQPSWDGEQVHLSGLGSHPWNLKMEITVYDDDLGRDDSLGSIKLNLSSLRPGKGKLRYRIQHHICSKDVYLEFNYETEGPWQETCCGGCSIQ